MSVRPDAVARLIFNLAFLPLLAVAGLAIVFAFKDHPIAAGVTAIVFAVLVTVLLVFVRPLILQKVRAAMRPTDL